MGEKTAAQKKYMSRFAIAKVRMNREKYDVIQTHAETLGESVNGFINRAIEEQIKRDAVN